MSRQWELIQLSGIIRLLCLSCLAFQILPISTSSCILPCSCCPPFSFFPPCSHITNCSFGCLHLLPKVTNFLLVAGVTVILIKTKTLAIIFIREGNKIISLMVGLVHTHAILTSVAHNAKCPFTCRSIRASWAKARPILRFLVHRGSVQLSCSSCDIFFPLGKTGKYACCKHPIIVVENTK